MKKKNLDVYFKSVEQIINSKIDRRRGHWNLLEQPNKFAQNHARLITFLVLKWFDSKIRGFGTSH